MPTHCLSLKEDHHPPPFRQIFDINLQYNNLNLNRCRKSSEINHLKSISNESGRILSGKIIAAECHSEAFSKKENKDLWKKNDNTLNRYSFHENFEKEEKSTKKLCKSSPNSSSTLSLHIAAYENSVEADNFDSESLEMKSNTFKKTMQKCGSGLSTSNFMATTFFEIPRQQEESESNLPEIMQFKATQKLLDPNNGDASKIKKNQADTDTLSQNDRNLIVEIQDGIGFIKISTTNVQSSSVARTKLPCLVYVDGGKQLFAKIRSVVDVTKVKAMAFMLMEPEKIKFAQVSNLRQKCREFCESNEMFCFLTSAVYSNTFAAISQSKLMVKEGEHVLVACTIGIGARGCVNVKLIREIDCYRVLGVDEKYIGDTLETFKPDKVVILENSYMDESDMNLAICYELNERNYHPIILKQTELEERLTAGTVDKVLHLMGEKSSIFDVGIPCEDVFDVQMGGKSVLKVLEYQKLPFEQTVIVDADSAKTVSLFQIPSDCYRKTPKFLWLPTQKPPELLQEISFPASKKAKITLKLDINSFHDLKVEPIEEDKTEFSEKIESYIKKLAIKH